MALIDHSQYFWSQLIIPSFIVLTMERECQRREPSGYLKLANFMVHRNHVIIKQFRELAIRNILYLQAELCDLQYDLADQSQQDANSQDEKIQRYDREWCHLRYAASGGARQWQLVLQARKTLQEYSMSRPHPLLIYNMAIRGLGRREQRKCL